MGASTNPDRDKAIVLHGNNMVADSSNKTTYFQYKYVFCIFTSPTHTVKTINRRARGWLLGYAGGSIQAASG